MPARRAAAAAGAWAIAQRRTRPPAQTVAVRTLCDWLLAARPRSGRT